MSGEISVRAPTTLEKGVILFLVAFLLIFPKGGIKLGGVPITWGYLALGPLALSLPLAMLFGRVRTVVRTRLVCLLMLLPFQAIVWAALLANGVDGIGFTISLIITFYFLPLVFILVFGVHLDRLDLTFLFRLLRAGILAVAVYGIFLFFYKLRTGSFIEIPYLTVNSGDVGEMENKHIDRGGIFKLISTYNNGNIYGICILLLLPLYAWLERSGTKHAIVKLSLLLTLSRTVWAGLVLYEVVQRVYVKRISFKTVALLTGTLCLLAAAILYAVSLIGLDTSFLFDRKLGGRIGQWSRLDTTVLPSARFEGILEIVYLSVVESFGMLGLACFLAGMLTPIVLHLIRAIPYGGTAYKRSLAASLAIYLVVALSDGAILYIPVMAFYWFVASLLLSPNPSFANWEKASKPVPRGGPSSLARGWKRVVLPTPSPAR